MSDVRSVIHFVVDYLQIEQPRDDYRELLELTIIFLGGVPSRGITLRVVTRSHPSCQMDDKSYILFENILIPKSISFNTERRNIYCQ